MKKALGIAAWILASTVIVFALAVAWFMRPLGAEELTADPAPLSDYQQAVDAIEAIDAEESDMDLQDVGRSYAMLHGSRVETAVVVFHGFTDVPDQFSMVAQGYFDAGYNVYVPRLPYHGYADRMTDDPSKITPELLRDFADDQIDISSGLGRNVEVVGLSGGGALATWAAAERADVDRTVIISPVMLPQGYKPWMIRPLARLVGMLPDSYVWWTDQEADEPGPEYPRYSRRGITAFLKMVERAKADGENGARPIKGDVVVVSNLSDQHLVTEYAVEVIEPLVAAGSAFRSVVIPASEGLKHDLVGLTGDNVPKLPVAYRYLSDAIGIPLPDPSEEQTASP